MKPIPEVYVSRRSTPSIGKPLTRLQAASLLVLIIVVTVGAVQFVRGFVNEYHQVRVQRDQAIARAESAEGQLALALRHGGDGILLARIESMGPGTLRFVPRAGR